MALATTRGKSQKPIPATFLYLKYHFELIFVKINSVHFHNSFLQVIYVVNNRLISMI